MHSKKDWSRNALANKQTIKPSFLPFYLSYVHSVRFISFLPTIYLSIYLSQSLQIYLSLFQSINPSIGIVSFLYIYMSIHSVSWDGRKRRLSLRRRLGPSQWVHLFSINRDSWSVSVILRTGAVVANARAHRLSSIIEKCHEPSACGQNDL